MIAISVLACSNAVKDRLRSSGFDMGRSVRLSPAPRMSCSRRMPHSIFWRAFEDGEVKVIGDEPGNTDYDPDRSEEAHTARRRLVAAEVSSRDTSLKRPTIVGLVVKPIGKAECRKSARSV